MLHDDEGLTFVLINLVNGADVGMIQGGGSASFPLKALHGLRIAREFGGKEFHGDEAAELGFLGLLDHAHAATSELL